MKWIIALVTSLALNVLLLLWGRGSFLAVVLLLSTSLWIGLPLLILAGVSFFISSRKQTPRLKTLSGYGITAALIIFSTMLTIPVSSKLVDYDVRRAKDFCEALGPKMERIKAKTGCYPRDLSEVIAGEHPPHLFEPKWFHSDGTNYSYTIADPGTIMGGWSYDNQRKHWEYWD